MEVDNKKNDENIIPNDADKSQKGVNVPNLRFDNESWTESKMGNVCSKFDYGIGAEAIDFDGKNRYIRITDIDEENSHYIRKSEVSPSFTDENCIVKENDILFARTGASTGKTYLYNEQDGKLYFAGFLIRANVKNEFSAYFIYQQTKIDRYKKWIKIMSARSGQPGINAKEYQEYKVYYPNRQIQDKVASFFTLLDQRIDTQSKIINIFKTLKKIISDQIFNKKDDKIRYEKLKNFAILKNGYAFKSDEYVNNGLYKIITISNVQGSRYIDISDCNTIDKLPNDLKSHQLLKLNDILISLTGNVGRVSLCNKQNCLLNQRVGLIEVIDKEMNEYLYQCLSNYYFEKTMISNGQGAAQLNISKNDVENFEIPINLDKRIVKLLEILDNKILLEQFFLEKLKEQKKYLLSNMFI